METHQSVERPGSPAFLLLFLAFAVILLASIGSQTRFGSGGGFFAQPRVWPAIGIGCMLIFSLAQLAFSWRSNWTGTAREVLTWLASLEYLAWFMVYVAAVPLAGYLAIRQGYRSSTAILSAAALGAAVVTVFKAGLSVRIPGAAAYEHLPDALRNFMIINF